MLTLLDPESYSLAVPNSPRDYSIDDKTDSLTNLGNWTNAIIISGTTSSMKIVQLIKFKHYKVLHGSFANSLGITSKCIQMSSHKEKKVKSYPS